MATEVIILRLVHILSAIFWVGTSLFSSFFLMPALASAGPAAGQVMATLQQRKLFVILPVVALLTMLSGLRLMAIASLGFQAAYFRSASGLTYAIGGVAAILAFLVGVVVVRPNAARAAESGAQLATAQDDAARATLMAQLEKARSRSASANLIAVVLLLIAAGGMAVARYLG